MRTALVTGAAGFIGSHLVERLLHDGWEVTGIDNLDPFYPEAIKRRNLAPALASARFTNVEADICSPATWPDAVRRRFDVIFHVAARAGVRPSIDDPLGYQQTNVIGTQNVLELARAHRSPQFVFASSSSVYGINPRVPWREEDHVLQPISPYASSKVSGELLGHVYSVLFGIRFIALRFFTVYGPRQRPDLAIHKFARRMLAGKTIPVYGDGSTRRDYTYIDDILSGVLAAADYTATPFEIINLGNDRTVALAELIAGLESVLGVPARVERMPEQPGDVPQTWASVEKASRLLGYRPGTDFTTGLRHFSDWLASHP
ncbi:MAG: NAD-dependent epimerase/dehydratase family protein [Vicinamibacterales bacterium]